MAKLAQTIVDHVKPLLDEANCAGYNSGYLNGEQSGYDQGHSDGYEQGKQDGASTGDEEAYSEGYNTGYSEGYDEGKDDGHSAGYDIGYEEALAEYWASMLDNGKRTHFYTAFAGIGWNDKTFRPPYDMIPSGTTVSGSATSMFNACHITDLAGILSSLGRKIDFSKAKSLKYCFSNSTITHLPRLDISSAETIEDLARGCTKLISIEGITLSETIVQKFTNSFKTCKSLQHLRWSGGSIKTDVDLSAATKLDRESIASTIKALYSFEEEGTLVTPEESLEAIDTSFASNDIVPMLIKLVEVPQDVAGYKVRWEGYRYDTWWDEETGEDVYGEVSSGGSGNKFNELGEACFDIYWSDKSFITVTNAEGEKVAYTYHRFNTDYEPTVTFSKQAVDKAFETSPGANDGSMSPAYVSTPWNLLANSRPMATISLI